MGDAVIMINTAMLLTYDHMPWKISSPARPHTLKVALDFFEEAANGPHKINHDDFAYEIGRKLGEAMAWDQKNLGDQFAH